MSAPWKGKHGKGLVGTVSSLLAAVLYRRGACMEGGGG